MRVANLGRKVGWVPFVSRNTCLPLQVQASRDVFPRYQSSSNGPPRTAQWTQHTLSKHATPPLDSFPSSVTSKSVSNVHTAYIALGSNLGDRISWIEKACNEMSARGIKVKRTSSLWETEPMYVLDQGNFINGACEVETTLEPLALLDELQRIENSLGRKKVIDKGPRNIDLDILLYDDQVIDHERLKIPHPGIFEREFVLRPLAELIPGKPLHPAAPWKVTQDYLNVLPPSNRPLSTITPLASHHEPIRSLDPKRPTIIMLIMNVTPNSFSDGGVVYTPNAKSPSVAFESSTELSYIFNDSFNRCPAVVIDVGGQSTAPGAEEVNESEERSRILPAIQWLTSQLRKTTNPVIISIDTYRAAVAEAAVRDGADIINDVSAGQMDPAMLSTMARLQKTVCLMHMRGTSQTMMSLTDYSPDGLIPTIAKELLERVAAAEEAGIRRWRIILDPGIGFAKTPDQDLEILRRFDELRGWPGLRGMPWLIGASRKKFIGKVTNLQNPSERDWATAAVVAAAVNGGADIVRVHVSKRMAEAAKMADAIWRV